MSNVTLRTYWSLLPVPLIAMYKATVTNAQSTDTPDPFQLQLQLSPSLTLLAPANIFFAIETQSGIVFCPSWYEGNGIMWIKTPKIPANTTYNLYAYQSTASLMDGINVGEAPQLSSKYGQYDNGANIFTFYDNFAGTSLNTTKWKTYGSPSITVNNGLTLSSSSSGTWMGIYTASPYNPQALVNDFYAYFTGLVGSQYGPEQTIGWGPGGYPSSAYNLGDYYSTTEYNLWNWNNQISAGNGVMISGGSTSSYQVWSLWATSSASYLSLNYRSPVSNSVDFVAMTSAVTGVGSMTTSYQIKVQWFRLRAYPPNGVMPSVSSFALSTDPEGLEAGASIYESIWGGMV